MIKRDYLQRIEIATTSDGEMGQNVVKTPKERVAAHVSIVSTIADMTQYGASEELILHTATDVPLNAEAHYAHDNTLFKIMRQVKTGNEYFQVLREVND